MFKVRWQGVIGGLLACLLLVGMVAAQGGPERSPAAERLAAVDSWLYMIDVNLSDEMLQEIAASDYDMVVIDSIVTEQENTDYDIRGTVQTLHDAGKLVVAYMDVGQAEDYRTYWQPGWRIGEPEWIVGTDPDGWSGNYPVAFWWDEWREIWLNPQGGLLQLLLDAGFDGIYMDWIEAYSDENVVTFAEQDGVDPLQEMIWFVEEINGYVKERQPDFIVIAQNAAELAEYPDYLAEIDAIAQEATWFDGAADGLEPEGDCPLPATESDVDTDAYRASLSDACRHLLDEDPESQLHTSSEWYLEYLQLAHEQGMAIFTVDYTLEPANITAVYAQSRALGFVPFAGPRILDRYVPPFDGE